MSKFVTTVLVPIIAGGALAATAMFGLVASQTSVPERNPADAEILTYGT